MPLYGHELDESVNPFQAGLDFAVDLEGRDFPGREAMTILRDDPLQPRRVGLALDGRRVPREGYAVYSNDEPVGRVTSGTFSPSFDRPIAMAYVARERSQEGTQLTIDIRGHREPARVVKLPFYTRPK
jgi:aminomethyltransferase